MVERAVILAKKPTLGVDDFPLNDSYNKKAADTVETLDLDTIEKHTIERALSKCDGNVSRAARLLGITRFVLYRKMERLGL
jgi:transcriptional regulator of acetoin/glycerol metabolism